MKKIVIAEKPSVGREIARVLSLKKVERGYIEGESYIVTWALGHLIELEEPAKYNNEWRRWSLSYLPMLPNKLETTVIKDSKEQFEIIDTLLKRDDIESVIIATDAGREGELVARWILEKADYKGKMERLWISSQTEKAIKEGFSNLKPSSEYDALYYAALSRAEADWYIGMNVTRALTCHYDARLSAGRVQTPTLAILVQKEDEIDSFLSSSYYSARANFGLFSASYYPEEGTVRFTDENKVKDLEELKGKTSIVIKKEEEEKSEEAEKAYDLTELQRDANITYGFSAKETLDILQKLYEVHKIVTYPRTDSRYITEDIVPTLSERIKALLDTPFSYQAEEYLKEGFNFENKNFVDSSKVSDHHAIIPTEEKVNLNNLSQKEKDLWSLIALRFLEVLGKEHKYKTTSITVEVENKRFIAKSHKTLSYGFKSVALSSGIKKPRLNEEREDAVLETIKEGQNLEVISVRVRKNNVLPPDRYTDATLLSQMERAGSLTEDEKAKENLKNGLGTPATRADIIEKLIQNRYVERDGKTLKATERGRELIRLAPSVLKSPTLTGRWEERLEGIKERKVDRKAFIADIKEMAKNLVNEVENSSDTFSPNFKETKKCPYCNSDMMKIVDDDGSIHYICQKMSCSYEEREVKKNLSSLKAQKQKKFSVSQDGKVKVVINKGPRVSPKAVFETEIEVVKSSKKENRNFPNSKFKEYVSKKESTGGTMADFFKLSKEREEERKNKRK